MRILVTGGAGFLGSHLCERLRATSQHLENATFLAAASFACGSPDVPPPAGAPAVRAPDGTIVPVTSDDGELEEGETEVEVEGPGEDKEIEVQVADTGGMGSFEIPGMPGSSVGMVNLSDMLGKAFGPRLKTRRMTVKASHDVLLAEESDKLLDDEQVVRDGIESVENNGIVFLDELDKICARSDRQGGDVSREGVQRDLLPMIEGTTVSTKHGAVRTDHILFIASGAFHIAKPSDLLPELQGRLPIRVELKALDKDDFRRILTEPEASLIKQYKALLATEGVDLEFTEDGIDALAGIAADINASIENIGARRLHTVLERVLDEVNFTATDRSGETVVVDSAFVDKHVGDLAKNLDLSKFIL